MYWPEIASSREFPQDKLVKHYDSAGRIVRIDFVSSGKYVLVEYLPEDTVGRHEPRNVRWPVDRHEPRKMWWSDGHVFLTWKEGDSFRFEHVARPFTCDIPRIACCGECDTCSYRDTHRTFYKSYNP